MSNLTTYPPNTVSSSTITSAVDNGQLEKEIDAKSLMGFVDNDNVDVSYDSTTRKVTITHPTALEVYFKGKKVTLANPYVSGAHTDAANEYFLYMTDSNGTIGWSTTPWTFGESVQMAIANYNTIGTNKFGLNEAHGLMPWQSHQEAHDLLGAYRYSGLGIKAGTYTVQPATPADADNTPGFDAGVIKDEDLKTTIAEWAEGTYSLLSFTGSNTAVISTTESFPFYVTGTYPNYNPYNGSTFSTAEMATNNFFNVYQIVLPATSDTESQKYRTLILQPQNVYTTATAALAEDFRSLNLGELQSYAPEFFSYTRITYSTNASYTTTGKCRINAITTITGTQRSQLALIGQNPESHANLQDLSTSGHPASIIDVTATGFSGNLSGTDTDVQTALATIDGLSLGGGGDTVVYKTADETFNNVGSYTDITDLSFAYDANSLYYIDIFFMSTNTDATNVVNPTIASVADSSSTIYSHTLNNKASTFSSLADYDSNASATIVASVASVAAGTEFAIQSKVLLTTGGSSGTYKLQCVQSDAYNYVIKKGTQIRYRKLA